MIEAYVKQLINAMTNDIRNYRDLALVLERRLDAIRTRKAELIEEMTASQEKLMRSLAINAQRRLQIVDKLTAIMFPAKAGKAQITVSEIAENIANPDKTKLLALKSMLHKEVDKVNRLNRINTIAIKKMLGHLDFIFKAISNVEHDTGIYDKEGKQQGSYPSSLIDAIA